MKRVISTFDYVLPPGPVTLTVTIGDGQVGGSFAELDGKRIGPQGEITDLAVGDAADLRGRVLFVKTGVLDINAMSNHTSVTYDLNGSSPGGLLDARVEVDNDRDAVIYETRIRFL
jgi:hypothetical protein